MAPVPALSEAEFDDLIRRMDEALGKVIDVANLLVERAERARVFLGALWDDVCTMLRNFVGLVEKLVAEIRKFLVYQGRPWTLFSHGEEWANHVGVPAVELKKMLDTSKLSVDDHWHGVAASAYLATLPGHVTALENVKAVTDDIENVLGEVGWGIVAFWTGMMGTVVGFLAAMAAAVAAALTGVGVPSGVTYAVGTVAATISAVLILIEVAREYFTTLITKTTVLSQRLKSGIEAWPRSSKNFANGRIYGGKLDWRLGQSE